MFWGGIQFGDAAVLRDGNFPRCGAKKQASKKLRLRPEIVSSFYAKAASRFYVNPIPQIKPRQVQLVSKNFV